MKLSEAAKLHDEGKGVIVSPVSGEPLNVTKDSTAKDLYVILREMGAMHLPGGAEVNFAWFDPFEHIRYMMRQDGHIPDEMTVDQYVKFRLDNDNKFVR